ncbi:hypothetical protein ACF0H5_009079 [Mactra antiquata]
MQQYQFDLADAGFFYTKESDIVECFACGVRVCQWMKEDVPANEHKKWSPDCVYISLTGTKEKYLEYQLFPANLCC